MSSDSTPKRLESLDGTVLSDRSLAGWEIASVISSVLIAEWILAAVSGNQKLLVALPLALAFALMIISHRLRRESLKDLGFRLDNSLQAIKLLILPMLFVAAACFLVGWFSAERVNFLRWHSSRPLVGQLALGFGWGLLQQYVLQGFVNRRAQIVFGRGWISVVLVAVVFGGLHLPNPWLSVLTFVGGLIWGAVYQRAPNLFVLALSHSIMTWILVSTLPASALNHLRIGFKYFS
jgi:membrane protease YdiL (CAAX protease family)